MDQKDFLFGFIFDQRPIRGVIVKLDQVIKTILAQKDYPLAIQNLLSEALVAIVLLFNLSKERGKMTLQFQSDDKNLNHQNFKSSGLIKLLSVQCTYDCKLRALAQWENPQEGDLNHELPFLELMGSSGKLVMTYQSESSLERFQSMIPLTGESLSDSIRAYFCQSEQLKTFLKITTADHQAAGMLLQLMPEGTLENNLENNPEDHFSHLSVLANTLTNQELLEDSPEHLLHKLFHQDPIRIFEPRELYFGCTCSLERMQNAIVLMGPEESLKILEGPDAKDSIEVKCEFCQNNYVFSRAEVEKLFLV